MIPSAFVFLDALPMTPTGKVDRRALPGRAARGRSWIRRTAPRNPDEETLVRIWSEVLGLEGIGVLDNLFELGGHSLVAAQIVTRVRDELAVDLALPEVFEHPTVESLAGRWIRPKARTRAELPPIGKAPRDQPIPLSFAQERVWFLTSSRRAATGPTTSSSRCASAVPCGHVLDGSAVGGHPPARGAADYVPRGGWPAGAGDPSRMVGEPAHRGPARSPEAEPFALRLVRRRSGRRSIWSACRSCVGFSCVWTTTIICSSRWSTTSYTTVGPSPCSCAR